MIIPKKKKIITVILISIVLGGISFYFFRHQKRKPNIILITMDALRPDYLGCYGYRKNTSPHIDTLAQDGVRFTQAISHSSHTVPSNASLITSMNPNIHKIADFGYKLNSQLPSLPDILKVNGYKTAFISDQNGFSWIEGFNRGFDTFNLLVSERKWGTMDKYKVVDIADWAINWLRNNKRKKFFLWLYYLDPHGPYIPSPPYNKLFVEDIPLNSDKILPISRDIKNQAVINCIPFYLRINNERRVSFYISQYCGEIRQIDASIGKLLKELEELDLYNNTIIIFTSDHGEGMGEHGQYFSHTIFLYDYLIKIPLIIRHPQLKKTIKKVTSQVRVIDIAPTILDFLGIKIPAMMQGASLKPLMVGKINSFSNFAFSQWYEKVSIRTEKWKLIYNLDNKTNELYNLENDPAEVDNLINIKSKEFRFLKQKLDKYINDSSPRNEQMVWKPDKNDIELLRSLGYIN